MPFLIEGYLSPLQICFSVAILINYLLDSFCSQYFVAYLRFGVMWMTLFLKLKKQALLASDFSSAAASPL